MFSLLRNRFGIPGVIAVVSLVFAMIGGAWAAGGGLTGKQKKEVTKIAQTEAKKFPGPAGLAGGPGPAGQTGPKGDAGVAGSAGKSVTVTEIPREEVECEGSGGALVKQEGSGSGTEVCNGTFSTEPLPSEQTLTGTWAVGPLASGATGEISISFPIRLAGSLDGSGCFEGIAKPTCQVHMINPSNKELTIEGTVQTTSAKCHGTAAAPTADPGNLCLYAADQINMVASDEFIQSKFDSFISGSSPFGAYVLVEATGSNAKIGGTWAVTAP